MTRTHLRTAAHGRADLPAIAQAHRLPHEVLEPVFTDLSRAGYASVAGDTVSLTPAGQEQLVRIQQSWREWLDAHLDDIALADAADRELLDQALTNIAGKLADSRP